MINLKRRNSNQSNKFPKSNLHTRQLRMSQNKKVRAVSIWSQDLIPTSSQKKSKQLISKIKVKLKIRRKNYREIKSRGDKKWKKSKINKNLTIIRKHQFRNKNQ